MLLQKIIYYKRDCYELSIGADMDDFASIRSALQGDGLPQYEKIIYLKPASESAAAVKASRRLIILTG